MKDKKTALVVSLNETTVFTESPQSGHMLLLMSEDDPAPFLPELSDKTLLPDVSDPTIEGCDGEVSDTFSSDDDSDTSNSNNTSQREDDESFNCDNYIHKKKRVLSMIKEVAISHASDEEEEDSTSFLSYDISGDSEVYVVN